MPMGKETFSGIAAWTVINGDTEVYTTVNVELEYEWILEEGVYFYSYNFPTAPLVAKAEDGREFTLAGEELEIFWRELESDSEFSSSVPFCGESEFEEDVDFPEEYYMRDDEVDYL
jgi:hypothetical protein